MSFICSHVFLWMYHKMLDGYLSEPGQIPRYYFVVVFHIFLYVKKKKNVLLHTEIHTGQMLFSCCYHCGIFKKFKQTCQLFCKPWITCFSMSTECNIGLTEDCRRHSAGPFWQEAHRNILCTENFCKMGCMMGKFGKVCMHTYTHTHTQMFRASIIL